MRTFFIVKGIVLALTLAVFFEPAWAQDTNRFLVTCRSEDDGTHTTRLPAVSYPGDPSIQAQGVVAELSTGAKIYFRGEARSIENGGVMYGSMSFQVRVAAAEEREIQVVGGAVVVGTIAGTGQKVFFKVFAPSSAIIDPEGLDCFYHAVFAEPD